MRTATAVNKLLNNLDVPKLGHNKMWGFAKVTGVLR